MTNWNAQSHENKKNYHIKGVSDSACKLNVLNG